MLRIMHYLTTAFMILIILSAIVACDSGSGSPGGDTDGDQACDTGLEWTGTECGCTDPNCCTDNSMCDPPQTCLMETHRCVGGIPTDGDEIDGDQETEEDEMCASNLDCLPTDTNWSCDLELGICLDEGMCDSDEFCTDIYGLDWICNESQLCRRIDEDGDLDIEDGDETDIDVTDGDNEPDADGDSEEDDSVTVDECPIATGLDALMEVDKMPCFRPLTVVNQVSSYSRRGDDQDCSGTNLYTENGEQVLMHSKRPGCVYRMWFGKPNQINGYRLKFYIDGEDQPSANLPIHELFGGATAPFLSPLVGEVNPGLNDGYFSYLPICYGSELKVTMSGGPPQCYHITYHSYADDTVVTPFSMDMDVSDVVDFYSSRIGEDPKPVTDGEQNTDFSGIIPANGSQMVFEDPSPSVLKAITFDAAQTDRELLDQLFIEVYYEGKVTEPDINVPIGLFFGSGFGEVNFKSLMMGMGSGEPWYSYYPMPYWQKCVIRLHNYSATPVQVDMTFNLGPNDFPRSAGHFVVGYSEELPTTDGQDYKALMSTGKGHVVGMTLAMESIGLNKQFLFGDERVYIDDMSSPLIHGTGTDNFFNGNNRFQGGAYDSELFSLWTNGGNPTYQYSARRLMPGDMFTFDRSISLGFEHGGDNDVNGNYRSATYYYYTCLEGLAATDYIDVGTTLDEQTHNVACELDTFDANIQGTYLGEYDDVTVTDSGRGITGTSMTKGYCEMKVAIDPNNVGVRLVRQFNYSDLNQDAIVYVDNEPVGNWYDAGQGLAPIIWRESVFDIPKEFTEGKPQIRVRFEYAGGSKWNIYKLWAYSFLPLSGMSEGPGQVDATEVQVQMVGLTPCLTWNTPFGVPPRFYHIYRSQDRVFDTNDTTFVETTGETTWCDPTPLAAQSTYYYRIIAEDCTGAKGIASQSIEINTGLPPYCFEAEETYDPAFSRPDAGEVQLRGAEYSNDRIIYYEFNGQGTGFCVLSDQIPYAGNYQVQVYFLNGPDLGQGSLWIDNSPQGSGFDSFAHDYAPSGPIDFGERYINPFDGEGNPRSVYFQFRITGKDASSTGYDIGIDRVCLLGIE